VVLWCWGVSGVMESRSRSCDLLSYFLVNTGIKNKYIYLLAPPFAIKTNLCLECVSQVDLSSPFLDVVVNNRCQPMSERRPNLSEHFGALSCEPYSSPLQDQAGDGQIAAVTNG
jgi:hypothetical protein